jgi:hypothetical protein
MPGETPHTQHRRDGHLVDRDRVDGPGVVLQMNTVGIGLVAAVAFALGCWCGRHPLTTWPRFNFWLRRREARRRDYASKHANPDL